MLHHVHTIPKPLTVQSPAHFRILHSLHELDERHRLVNFVHQRRSGDTDARTSRLSQQPHALLLGATATGASKTLFSTVRLVKQEASNGGDPFGSGAANFNTRS